MGVPSTISSRAKTARPLALWPVTTVRTFIPCLLLVRRVHGYLPSVESALGKKMNPAGAVLAEWVAALPERLDNGIGGTHQPARCVSHPRRSASIGRWYRSIVGDQSAQRARSLPQAPHRIARCSRSDGSDNPAADVTDTCALAAEDARYLGCKGRWPVCRTRWS